MITSQLGSATGDLAAKGAAAIPVVGTFASGLIKVMDALLPTTQFCDPRSKALMAQMALADRMRAAAHPGTMFSQFEIDAKKKNLKLIEQYEADCKAGLTTAPYIHCMYMTDERSKSQCEQAVARKIRLREAAEKIPTTTTKPPWYKNPLVWGGGAVAALGAYLLLR